MPGIIWGLGGWQKWNVTLAEMFQFRSLGRYREVSAAVIDRKWMDCSEGDVLLSG